MGFEDGRSGWEGGTLEEVSDGRTVEDGPLCGRGFKGLAEGAESLRLDTGALVEEDEPIELGNGASEVTWDTLVGRRELLEVVMELGEKGIFGTLVTGLLVVDVTSTGIACPTAITADKNTPITNPKQTL